MAKIKDVLTKQSVPPLQMKVLTYLNGNLDEVYSLQDREDLAKKVRHQGSPAGIGFSLWALYKKGYIDKERLGKRVYFGSKSAVSEFRKAKRGRPLS